ncbi:MAG: hypothetical protein HQL52_07745 [Magnetococcales bacterium]|nr:hypothetical protein [Magnetococcales bacterium]
MAKEKAKAKWEQVGVCSITSGRLWIGDPSFCAFGTKGGKTKKTVMTEPDKSSKASKKGSWVCLATPMPDGNYPVEVRRTDGGKIRSVRVRLM